MYAKRYVMLLLLLSFTACVTVNVYFPAAEAQKAANDITKEIYGPQPAPPESVPRAVPEPQSGLPSDFQTSRLSSVLVAIAEVEAAANLAVSSPMIDKLRQSMKGRNATLLPHYRSGAVGVTRDGLLELRPDAQGDKSAISQLVAQENADRNALYAEIANANGHPEWATEIRRTFAGSWISNGPSGLWFQDTGGKWQRK